MSDVSGTGDCMLAAYNLALTLPGTTLCHGIVRGRGNMKGEQFWHAWVETERLCVDFSNDRRAALPTDMYYMLCAITAFQVRRYTRDEAIEQGTKWGTCGPWPPPLQDKVV